MECRTSDALKKKALGRILDIFPNDRDIYENWQKYSRIYSIGYKDAPSAMDDITDYWGSLGYDYNAGFREGTRRALLRVALSIVNNSIKHGVSQGYLCDQVQTCTSPECFAIGKYKDKGIEGLYDRRGKNKAISQLSDIEKLKAENRLLKAQTQQQQMEIDFLKNSTK